jgi:asparagine synthase (glutamine-hydrolysing)
MSAITGIFNRNGLEVKPELMKKMNNRLSHRGLDGSGIYCNGPVAMGHQMLKTTPESLHEKLPFHDEKTGLTITADARIDNRQELSEKLGISDRVDVPDSYFILKSYQTWGDKCPEELIGEFAFVIWDEINESLFCARDHIGVKPFYYYF